MAAYAVDYLSGRKCPAAERGCHAKLYRMLQVQLECIYVSIQCEALMEQTYRTTIAYTITHSCSNVYVMLKPLCPTALFLSY